MASPQVVQLTRLRAVVEAAGSFAIDQTGSLGSFIDIPANEGTMQLTLATAELDPNYNVQRRSSGREKVLGPRKASLKFVMNMAPTGTAAASTVAAVQGPLGLLLKAVMGGEHLGTGTTFTGGTALVPNVTSAAGLVAGGFIGWTNSSSVVEWRRIKAINTLAITLDHAFSGAPANSNVCYAAATYYVTEDPNTSLQFICYGQSTSDRWLVLGAQCVGGFDIALDPSGKAIPTITFNFEAANYYDSTQTAGAINGTLAAATFTNYNPIVEYVGDLQMFTVGTPTYVATTSRVLASAFTYKPKTVFTAVTNPAAYAAQHGGSPIERYRGGRLMPPVAGTITTFMDALTFWTKRDTKADLDIQYTTGIAAGSSIIFGAPTSQILNPQRGPSDQEIEGVVAQYEGRDNTDTALTTDLALSPYVIGVG